MRASVWGVWACIRLRIFGPFEGGGVKSEEGQAAWFCWVRQGEMFCPPSIRPVSRVPVLAVWYK